MQLWTIPVAVTLLLTLDVAIGDVVFALERATHVGLTMNQLRQLDRARHARFLQQQPIGVVNFPVRGTYDPFLVGLYFTKVKLGSPAKEFYVQIDTGSDVLWVNCNPCNGCPTSSGLQIELEYFDPSSSSTVSPISCSDQRCALGAESSDSGCTDRNQCGYTFQYGDGSGTSGFYVSDAISFESIVDNSLVLNSSARVVFGCSTSLTGDLIKPDRAVDGIFGFGQQGLSVISQLSSQGVTPKAFSHCLKGEDGGGGILVLGQIVEPNLVYTPLVQSSLHYNVNLQSISINGQTLNIDSSVFATSENRGTIIDSGTTLAYLAEEAHDIFVLAISQIVSQYVSPAASKADTSCFVTTSSVSDIFPPVSLNFAGGASMILRPQDYLLQKSSTGGSTEWCIGIQKIPGQGITILGDIVLKDKIVVYDLGGQRIGWANYDCSSSVNVSATTSTGKTEYLNPRQFDNSSPSYEVYKLVFHVVAAALFGVLPFL